jgi:hypothetical protein
MRRKEASKKKKAELPSNHGIPRPASFGGTQEHTAAHLPEADLRKARELFSRSPPRAGELRTVREQPRPARQGGKGNSAEHHRGGHTGNADRDRARSSTHPLPPWMPGWPRSAAAADAAAAAAAATSDGPAASPDASTGREGMEWADVQSDSRRRGGRGRDVEGRRWRWWTWEWEKGGRRLEGKRNWKLGNGRQARFQARPPARDGGRSNRGRSLSPLDLALLSLLSPCFRCLCFSS